MSLQQFRTLHKFSTVCELFQQKFLTCKLQFSRARASIATSWGYAAKYARDALQRDTFKVGIALLTAMPTLLYVVVCAHGLDSEFTKLFQRNLQKPSFARKIRPSKIQRYTVLLWLHIYWKAAESVQATGSKWVNQHHFNVLVNYKYSRV